MENFYRRPKEAPKEVHMKTMKKMSRREAVVEAKNEINLRGLNSPEDVTELLREFPMRKDTRMALAIRWVLSTGTWEEDLRWGWRFYLPSTEDVLAAWHGQWRPRCWVVLPSGYALARLPMSQAEDPAVRQEQARKAMTRRMAKVERLLVEGKPIDDTGALYALAVLKGLNPSAAMKLWFRNTVLVEGTAWVVKSEAVQDFLGLDGIDLIDALRRKVKEGGCV